MTPPRSTYRTPDPLIRNRRFWLLPAVSGCVPYSVGQQCFSYCITSCRSRSIPVNYVSFAPHKRHQASSALANLLSDVQRRDRGAGDVPRPRRLVLGSPPGFDVAAASSCVFRAHWSAASRACSCCFSGRSPHSITQRWVRRIVEAFTELDGLRYNSRFGGHPCAALFLPSITAMPDRPVMSLPLTHPGLVSQVAVAARLLGYAVI
jgi:hypothetical protein